MQPLTVLVVEDYEPFRRAVCLSLRRRTEFQVIEASDGLEAVEKARELRPGLILFDISLPKMNGFDSARQVQKSFPRPNSCSSVRSPIRRSYRKRFVWAHKATFR